ncbi:thiamine phosphate synthase [Sporolactobacillus vineae]|uniref:thiamine phosphate synthase n=1 Tax=Sporolactobacillus vineae TaxID=444463 RepID=UPI000288ABB8|nr:thiamine phosphate synthase [Sporolactobacillus vineae]
MPHLPIDYSLYLVSDPYDPAAPDRYFNRIRDALRGGTTLLQFREKKASSKQLLNIAATLKKLAGPFHVPLIINDRVDLALAVDADGVHVGQNDLPARVVRRLIGSEKIVGVSAATVAEAVQAEADGADYLGVGSIFPTRSKADATVTSIDELKAIRRAVHIPIVAIGGIDRANLRRLDPADIDGIAVISAILSQQDVTGAAKKLKECFLQLGDSL